MLLNNLKKTLLASTVALLCACNSEIDDLTKKQNTTHDDHEHATISSKGRLVISHADTANVSVFNADDNGLLEVFNTAHNLSGVYASPANHFAVLIQRADNYVEFIDGVLFCEDHDDHLHHYQQAPELSSFVLTNEKPTHFDNNETKAALFFDGNIDADIPACFNLLSDESIEAGETLTTHSFENAMHVTAQTRGDTVMAY